MKKEIGVIRPFWRRLWIDFSGASCSFFVLFLVISSGENENDYENDSIAPLDCVGRSANFSV